MNDLPGQFLMLATRDRSGRPMGYHQYGFGAAVMAEMVLNGHLLLERGRIHAERRPADPLYATVWHDVQAGKPRKARWWVQKLSGGRYRLLRRQFAQRLVDAGHVTEVQGWFRSRYPTKDPSAEAALRERIADAVASKDSSDDRLVCLVAITVAASSHAEIHPDRATRRRIRRQAKRWMKSQEFARSISDLIAGLTMAVTAGAIAASAGA